MPIYEYECHVCGHRLEKLQKIADAPLKDCPACAESGLRKLVSPVAFRLKGGGWYETDFKDEKARRNLAQKDAGAGEADAGKGDDAGKTDTAGKAAETKKDSDQPPPGGGDKGPAKGTKAGPDTTGAAASNPAG